IAVTALATPEYEQKGLESGCDAYIAKPITLGNLRRPWTFAPPMLSRHPLPTTRPSAPTRRHQTRHWHLPLLPHPRWPRRHCCWPPPHRTHHHSCSRLTNLRTRCKHSVRKRLSV